MQVVVHVPTSLREFSGGARQVRLECDQDPATVADVFDRLRCVHPGVAERALDEQGQVREHVNVFVDSESIRLGAKRGLATPISHGGEVWILPSVSGG
jgi:sulfur-carrier protein